MEPHQALRFPPVVDALRPILPAFRPFLTDADAARLWRTSRVVARTLLSGYSFNSHVFQPVFNLRSLRQLRDLHEAYGLLIRQLRLGQNVLDLSFDHTPPHRSPVPASVTGLILGSTFTEDDSQRRCWTALCSGADHCWEGRDPWKRPELHPSPQSDEEEEEEERRWQLRRWLDDVRDGHGPLPLFADSHSEITDVLEPGLLPAGLRALRLSYSYNCPLLPGALPDSLKFLQLGGWYNQPLPVGVLPSSLRCLSLSPRFRQPLLPGSLPQSLERLRLGDWSRPLQVGVLPPHLKALHIGDVSDPLQPLVLPTSLLYLSFGFHYNQRLHLNVLPPGLVELRLSERFDYPLAPGVLPSSLRRLRLGSWFRQQLVPGSLPEGLLFLLFYPKEHCESSLPPLQPGVLPSTLLGVDFSNRCEQPLPAGVVPSSVRWVRLCTRYRDEDIEAVLPSHAQCSWYAN